MGRPTSHKHLCQRQGGSHLSGPLRYFPAYRQSNYRTPAQKSPTDATLLILVGGEGERRGRGERVSTHASNQEVTLRWKQAGSPGQKHPQTGPRAPGTKLPSSSASLEVGPLRPGDSGPLDASYSGQAGPCSQDAHRRLTQHPLLPKPPRHRPAGSRRPLFSEPGPAGGASAEFTLPFCRAEGQAHSSSAPSPNSVLTKACLPLPYCFEKPALVCSAAEGLQSQPQLSLTCKAGQEPGRPA